MLRLPIRLICLKPAYRPSLSRTFTTDSPVEGSASGKNDQKASPEQLALVEHKLTQYIPKFFKSPPDYTIYTKDVIFINNLRNNRTQGIAPLALQISLARMYHAIRYSSSRVELLNLVKNPEESYIRIRWRIISKPGMIKFVLSFWKFRSIEIWTDGISTIHVNSNGLVYCHVCDNIDYETKESESKGKLGKSIKNPLVNRSLNV